MNWYVLRVDMTHDKEDKNKSGRKPAKEKTESEERVLLLLKSRLPSEIYTPFIPKKIYPHTKGRKLTGKHLKICFPGYVFIATEKDDDAVIRETRVALDSIKQAHFFLYYNDNCLEHSSEADFKHRKREYTMREQERRKLEEIMNDEFVIDGSVGFMEGERVKVISGALKGWEGNIKKLNKRRMTAVIDLGLFRGNGDVTIMLEVVEKL